ncbi:MAG: hypothetical protein SPF96_01650 [Prevotella sp.]|nr:hypothetical protein [Prevotella sp.]
MIIPHRAVLTDGDGVAVEVVELTRDTVLRYLLVFVKAQTMIDGSFSKTKQ